MESLQLNLQSKKQLTDYVDANHLMPYERAIFQEMITSIELKDQIQLNWFHSFGASFRTIMMNVQVYRNGLEFGFSDISFDKHGWFTRSLFLDREELSFGDKSRYGNHSLIYLGRDINHVWTYGMNYSFGVAGGCYGLSVYGKQFKNREDALNFALIELKNMMVKKIGSTDTTNDKQPVILASLHDIEKALVGMVELSLF